MVEEVTFYSEQALAKGTKLLERVCEDIRRNNNITKAEKAKLFEYREYKESQGKKPVTIEKVLRYLYLLRVGSNKHNKGGQVIAIPYTDLDYNKPDQFLKIFADINRQTRWGKRTKTDVQKAVLTFMKFLDGIRRSRPKGLEFVEIGSVKGYLDPTRMLTFEDIKYITAREETAMMRAMVWVAFETAARPSELISMKIRDIAFVKDDMVRVRIPQTKTVSREFEVRDCRAALEQWLLIHPAKDNPEAPLFCMKRGTGIEALNESYLRNYLVLACEKAGIKGKNTAPKWFRKAGMCDWIARRKVDNPHMLMRIVGHVNINTAQAYVEFTGTQLNDYLKERYGIGREEPRKEPEIPPIVPIEKPEDVLERLTQKEKQLERVIERQEFMFEMLKSRQNENYLLSSGTPEAGFEPALPGGK